MDGLNWNLHTCLLRLGSAADAILILIVNLVMMMIMMSKILYTYTDDNNYNAVQVA